MVQNPKTKGGQWERDFCRYLSLWWSKGEDEDIFWRTASSGGKATVNQNLPTQLGDVTNIKPEGQELITKFVFELKHYNYKGLDWLPLLDQKGNIYGWWEKLCAEAKPYDKIPFLVIKVSHRGVYGVLPSQYFIDKYLRLPAEAKTTLDSFAFWMCNACHFSVFKLDKFLEAYKEDPKLVL